MVERVRAVGGVNHAGGAVGSTATNGSPARRKASPSGLAERVLTKIRAVRFDRPRTISGGTAGTSGVPGNSASGSRAVRTNVGTPRPDFTTGGRPGTTTVRSAGSSASHHVFRS